MLRKCNFCELKNPNYNILQSIACNLEKSDINKNDYKKHSWVYCYNKNSCVNSTP